MRYTELGDADCAIAQALGVVGEWWSLLVVRDVAGGLHRFDELQRELGISRKVLTQRLGTLVEHGVLERRPYSAHPPRFDYHLTDKGRGLLPVLVALQDWGTRHVMGDGSLTATSAATSPEARPGAGPGRAPARGRPAARRRRRRSTTRWDRLPGRCSTASPARTRPAAGSTRPAGASIPGAAGCTLESLTYKERHAAFAEAGATVHGVSTQRPDQLAAFAEHAGLPFPLLSDTDLTLAASLRLPTFRGAGVDRLKRLTLVRRREAP